MGESKWAEQCDDWRRRTLQAEVEIRRLWDLHNHCQNSMLDILDVNERLLKENEQLRQRLQVAQDFIDKLDLPNTPDFR